jgi:hypothetical protein
MPRISATWALSFVTLCARQPFLGRYFPVPAPISGVAFEIAHGGIHDFDFILSKYAKFPGAKSSSNFPTSRSCVSLLQSRQLTCAFSHPPPRSSSLQLSDFSPPFQQVSTIVLVFPSGNSAVGIDNFAFQRDKPEIGIDFFG